VITPKGDQQKKRLDCMNFLPLSVTEGMMTGQYCIFESKGQLVVDYQVMVLKACIVVLMPPKEIYGAAELR
jgi:hypothetical protein